MNVSPCNTPPHFMFWEGAHNLIFCMEFDICYWQKWYDVDNKGLPYDIKSAFNDIYILRECQETLKQQWVSLLIAHHPIFCVRSVPKIWHFAWNLGWFVGGNDTLWTRKGLYMLSEAHPLILIHPKEAFETLMQQWMSLLTANHLIFYAKRMPKIWQHFVWNLRVVIGRNDIV